MTTQDERKRAAAEAALAYVEPASVLGVGTGTTIDQFIRLLAERRVALDACVSSSERSARALEGAGYRVVALNDVDHLPLYVDGADEVDPSFALTKGGGGALTREKIVASAAKTFVCIVDASKRVPRLGAFPLPVEVIPMAERFVARELGALGGAARTRAGFVTDNGNLVLDVSGLAIDDPDALEASIGAIAGVVTVGLFARRRPDVLLVAGDGGVTTLERARG